MWESSKECLKLFSTTTNTMTWKKAKIVLEDGCTKKIIFLPKSEINNTAYDKQDETYEVIDNVQLVDIEDGLMNFLYFNCGRSYFGVIDLHKHIVNFICVNNDNHNETINKKGSFYLLNEFDQPDYSPFTNQEKALDFWNRYFNLHDETAIDEYLKEPYIQHNPNVPDGVEAFRNEFHDRFYTDMKESSTIVKRVSSRNNLVFIHNILKRSPTVKGHAAVDIFRFENGKIVEHWDVIQKMPESSKNDHPMF